MRHSDRRTGSRTGFAAVLTAVVVWSAFVGVAVGGPAPGGTADVGVGVDGDSDGLRSDAGRAVGQTVNVTVTPRTVAAGVGDRVDLSGTAATAGGSIDEVRLYLIGPRGRFLDADGEEGAMETATVRADGFDAAYAAFPRRGTYSLLVVSPRDDGFETTETLGRDALPSGATRRQAVELVRSAHGGDEVLSLTLRGATPSITVDEIDDDGTVGRQADVPVSGTSNRGNDTSVVVDVLDRESRRVGGSTASVDAAAGRWATTVNTSELRPGTYTVFVDDGAASASTLLIVVDEEAEGEADGDTTTPAETPLPATDGSAESASEAGRTVETVTGAVLDNATDGLGDASAALGNATGRTGTTPTTDAANGTDRTGEANDTATTNGTTPESETPASTSEGLPGFGVGVAVAALVVAALAARRRTGE
jgi:PGF-CTERM protein